MRFEFYTPPRKRIVNMRYPARQVMTKRPLRNDSKCVELKLSCAHVVHRPRFDSLGRELIHDIAHCEHCPRRSCQ